MEIDFSETVKSIEKLKDINLNEANSYEKIKKILETIIVPYNVITLNQGQYIFRGRRNENGEIFTQPKQLTYRTDVDNIENFGRANEPHQTIFYGANNTETALLETSSLFNDSKVNLGVEEISLGRWYVRKTINLLGIINYKATKANSIVKNLQEEANRHPFNSHITQYILAFFSNEFSRNARGKMHLYKISCAYFNHVVRKLYDEGIMGVAYPSVQNEYKGLNVALIPEAVDNFMVMDMVGIYKINTISRNMTQTGLVDIRNFKR